MQQIAAESGTVAAAYFENLSQVIANLHNYSHPEMQICHFIKIWSNNPTLWIAYDLHGFLEDITVVYN